MGRSVDSHDIPSAQLFPGAEEIIDHAIFTVDPRGRFIRSADIIVFPALFNRKGSQAVFRRILFAFGFQQGQVAGACCIKLVPHVCAVENRVRECGLNAAIEVPGLRGVIVCSPKICEDHVQQFVCILLHPPVQICCRIGRKLNEKVPHTVFIAFRPGFQFFFQTGGI